MSLGVAYYLFCPVHFPLADQCDSWCEKTRNEHQQAADALRKYWPLWRLRMQARHGRHFFDTPKDASAA